MNKLVMTLIIFFIVAVWVSVFMCWRPFFLGK